MSQGDLASYFFHQGTNFRAYDYLGCSLKMVDGKYEYTFRTWAPNANSVGLVSDFSGWYKPIKFSRATDNGIWELVYTSDISLELMPYKFRIVSASGVHDKGDPYARFSRSGADGASLIFTDNSFKWGDKAWLSHRRKTICESGNSYMATPINIYEMHMGSFMRHEEDNRYYSYLELADILPGYLKKMGYTHVEFLPLQEYPFDGSWGYQVCAFYAPTSRFGTPNDFRHLINSLHKAGIGVIMDWVPAHFPKDEWGLYEFDGSPLYEYQGRDRKESRSWGTRFFDLGREEIQSFLISNALYFFREFHIDGLRVDAVASMIYLDYDRMPGEWVPNAYGTNENLEATAFLRKLNTSIFAEFPDALMIAEESTAFGGITHPVSEGGLGFNMKWNMGWANDFYDYVQLDAVFRKYNHKALNFPIMYAFNEKYCLPISHDEVVHGKKSFINKMEGSYEDKFKQARTSLMLMMTYPGKKLLFMGTEYGQFREWDFANSLEWFMLDYPNHKYFRDYTASLNHFYLAHRELWELDFNPEGFEWILADEADKNSVVYKRLDKRGRELYVALNFSGGTQYLTIPTARGLRFESLFDTGDFSPEQKTVQIEKTGSGYIAHLSLPPYSGIIYKKINANKKIKI
ncbi:MAG: 1,4-alpha-glucan branching protein GlgB [Ruminococcaceae bacterium]|nr:1,4-alpha-glucan branching protein GlgB [Oscillospiraceae bacterium]